MSEATGAEAKTLHRLLEYGGDERRLRPRRRITRWNATALIVDEMSMVDVFLMRVASARARPRHAADSGRRRGSAALSVGAGNVLRDILDSGVIPSVRLTEIFRQDEKSMIVLQRPPHQPRRNAPYSTQKDSDFFFERARLPRPKPRSAIVRAAAPRRLPELPCTSIRRPAHSGAHAPPRRASAA